MCGTTIEFDVAELKYSALGFIFINVPGISRFQWHPFSTTSSSLHGDGAITICIKPLGEWTRNLQKMIIDADSANPKDTKSGGCPLALRLFVEGPYGPEKDYFLEYKTLVLIAGGVGVTPFVALLRDLLCRYNHEGSKTAQGLPSEVHLIWCVPKKADLATLRDLQPAALFPGYVGGPLKIDVKAFVTREQPGAVVGNEKFAYAGHQGQEYSVYNNADVDDGAATQKAFRDMRGSNLWMAAVIAAATGGFMLFLGIFHYYVVRPNHHNDAPFFFEHGSSHGADHGPQGKPFPTWVTVSLLFISMLLGVVVFGGAVLFAWAKLGNRGAVQTVKRSPKVAADLETNEASLLEQASLTEGNRPILSGNQLIIFFSTSGYIHFETLNAALAKWKYGGKTGNPKVQLACRNFAVPLHDLNSNFVRC